MAIKVKERAQISDNFKKVTLKLYREVAEQLAARRATLKDAIYIASLLKPEVQDREWTRLRGIEYTKFGVRKAQYLGYGGATEELWLFGETKDIHIEYDGIDHNFGPYSVKIPLCSPKNCNLTYNNVSIHAYPLRNPLSHYRTPHSYAPSLPSTETESPLYYPAYICWGSFSSQMNSLIRKPNIPDFFETMYLYLASHNPNSILHGASLRMFRRDCDWVKWE